MFDFQLQAVNKVKLEVAITGVYFCLLPAVETGDDISECIDSECLVIVNHQSTGDVPIIMQALTDANKRHLSRHVCWILDNMFKYANFGLPCHVHGDFFILQVQFFVLVFYLIYLSMLYPVVFRSV